MGVEIKEYRHFFSEFSEFIIIKFFIEKYVQYIQINAVVCFLFTN